MARLRRPSKALRARLAGAVRAGRRDTIYKMLAKKHDGTVPCFVCGRHVRPKNATLEHIVATSKGGTDDMDNLSISHYQCNQRRGAGDAPTVQTKEKEDE